VLFLYTPAIAGRFVERMMEGPEEPGGNGQAVQGVRLGTARPESALSRPALCIATPRHVQTAEPFAESIGRDYAELHRAGKIRHLGRLQR
jgi:hypothetical protein